MGNSKSKNSSKPPPFGKHIPKTSQVLNFDNMITKASQNGETKITYILKENENIKDYKNIMDEMIKQGYNVRGQCGNGMEWIVISWKRS